MGVGVVGFVVGVGRSGGRLFCVGIKAENSHGLLVGREASLKVGLFEGGQNRQLRKQPGFC